MKRLGAGIFNQDLREPCEMSTEYDMSLGNCERAINSARGNLSCRNWSMYEGVKLCRGVNC